MTLLILGLLIWTVAHLFKRVAPDLRARTGNAGKGLVAVLVLAGLVLMVVGYRGADFVPVYTPLPGMGHLMNLLMLGAVYLFGVGHARGRMAARIRHPMLWGVVVWAVAHLLVNGDLASLVLFGGLAIWALVEMTLINAAGPWARPRPGALRGDLVNVAITLVVYAVASGIHIWLGRNPFMGTYG